MFYQISREKFEPEPGHELGPPDLQPGALPFSHPGSTLLKFDNVNVERHKL